MCHRVEQPCAGFPKVFGAGYVCLQSFAWTDVAANIFLNRSTYINRIIFTMLAR